MKTFIEKHKLLNHPFAELVTWFTVGNICSLFIFPGIAGFIAVITNELGVIGTGSSIEDILSKLIIIIGGIILLYYFKKRYSPCFKGFGWLENCKQKDIIICMAIFIGVDLVIWIIDLINVGGIKPPTLATLVGALQPGITEEITDRLLPLAAAMYIFKKDKSVVPLLLFTSVLFGVSHIFNLFAGADLAPTILQIFSACSAGVFMGAAYLRTGSFLPGMFVHFLHDFLSFLSEGMGVATGAISILDISETLVFGTVQLVLTYFLIKGKNESIQTIWNKIWVNVE